MMQGEPLLIIFKLYETDEGVYIVRSRITESPFLLNIFSVVYWVLISLLVSIKTNINFSESKIEQYIWFLFPFASAILPYALIFNRTMYIRGTPLTLEENYFFHRVLYAGISVAMFILWCISSNVS